MRPLGPAVLAIVAAVVAAVVIVAIIVVPGQGGKGVFYTTFDFSQNLPTGTTYSNGQTNCGSNVTESLAVPSYTTVNMSFTMNESGSSANIWMTGPGSGDRGFLSVGYGGVEHEEMGVGLGGQLEFFLQGCGPTPTVPLGLWGNITSFSGLSYLRMWASAPGSD